MFASRYRQLQCVQHTRRSGLQQLTLILVDVIWRNFGLVFLISSMPSALDVDVCQGGASHRYSFLHVYLYGSGVHPASHVCWRKHCPAKARPAPGLHRISNSTPVLERCGGKARSTLGSIQVCLLLSKHLHDASCTTSSLSCLGQCGDALLLHVCVGRLA